MQILQRRILHFVNALDLPHQQLRIADQLERLGTVLDRIFERSDQSLILGKIVGLVAEIFAQRRDLASRFVFDHHTVAGGPGIAARSAVAVRNQVMLGRILAGLEEMLGSGAAREVRE